MDRFVDVVQWHDW